MDLVELTILTVLLGGIVLAVATLWAWRGTRTRQAEDERVSPQQRVVWNADYQEGNRLASGSYS